MCGTAKILLTPWDPNDGTEGTGETLSDPKVGTEGTKEILNLHDKSTENIPWTPLS